jgi:hypothetical protein
MNDVATCPHNNTAITANVTKLTDNPDKPEAGTVVGWACDLTMTCTDCGGKYGFLCATVGVDPTQPATDPSGTELRLPVLPPDEMAKRGPLAALHFPEPKTPGFKVGRRAS